MIFLENQINNIIVGMFYKFAYVLMSRPPPDVRLLLPSLFFVALMWILCVIALNFIRLGRNHWCNGIVFMLGFVERQFIAILN